MFQSFPDFPNHLKVASFWPPQPSAANALAIIERCRQLPAAVVLAVEPSVAKANQLWNELTFFKGDNAALDIVSFADYETLPYDIFSPNADIISERLQLLSRLTSIDVNFDSSGAEAQKTLIIVASIDTLMQRLPPKSFIQGNSFDWSCGDIISINKLAERFTQAGYLSTSSVQNHGEFCVRGALLDIFPMGSQYPLRLDFFDNELDTLRLFDAETQMTITKIQHFQLLPAHEYLLSDTAVARFKTRWFEFFETEKAEPLRMIEQQRPFPGIESYLPLLHDKMVTLIDYLPAQSFIIQNEQAIESFEQYWQQIQQRYEDYPNLGQRPPLPPAELFLPLEQWNERCNKHLRIKLNTSKAQIKGAGLLEGMELTSSAQALQSLVSSHQQVIFCAINQSRRETLHKLLQQANIEAIVIDELPDQQGTYITVAPISDSFSMEGIAFISEQTLLGGRPTLYSSPAKQTTKRKTHVGERLAQDYIRNLMELEEGDPVVHFEHGVGIYKGLETLTVRGQTDEFLVLLYAGNDKLYVPVSSLHLISRFTSSHIEEVVKLHKLGGEQWSKARDKAQKVIRDSAAELLEIYARRSARQGSAIDCDKNSYSKFCAEFPFEETLDQLDAIEAIRHDMSQAKPMDRLVCGDVGFGKTEVAMRAAFIAAASNKQTVLMVPTTLLASQHLETLAERFSNWPFQVDLISRLQAGNAEKEVLKRFNAGKVDILIGTHKLLFADLDFSNLGLLIIDEEHRFGVRQKEKLKALRAEVDILSLTATPIPRTLNMALSSMRDLSIIAQPPAKRLSVKTFICMYDLGIIKEAIQRELHRGGQVYFLHNEIKTIERTANALAKLIPEAKIAVGHGQMRERELERVMFNFHQQRSNILVCSTIIETGIDNPNANTIIMERADKLGLAQLHQLRGRVGRSYHQAYAYLLTPEPSVMSKDARKRLDAIKSAEHLGSGFTLATYDLEIRGAGELLGEQQSGQINAIGFDLFQEMLDKAVRELRKGNNIDDLSMVRPVIDINIGLSALIPSDYLPDVNLRLGFYKKMAATKTQSELDTIQIEMVDRFGSTPDEVNYLFITTALRQRCDKLGIEKIIGNDKHCKFWIHSDNLIEAIRIVNLMQQHPDNFSMEGGSVIKFMGDEQYSLAQQQNRAEIIPTIIDVLAGDTQFKPRSRS